MAKGLDSRDGGNERTPRLPARLPGQHPLPSIVVLAVGDERRNKKLLGEAHLLSLDVATTNVIFKPGDP